MSRTARLRRRYLVKPDAGRTRDVARGAQEQRLTGVVGQVGHQLFPFETVSYTVDRLLVGRLHAALRGALSVLRRAVALQPASLCAAL